MSNKNCYEPLNLCDVGIQVEMEGISRIEPDRIFAEEGYRFRIASAIKDTGGEVRHFATLVNDKGEDIGGDIECVCGSSGDCTLFAEGHYAGCKKGGCQGRCRLKIKIKAKTSTGDN